MVFKRFSLLLALGSTYHFTCSTSLSPCIHRKHIPYLSPRVLGDTLATFGPLLVWMPLYLISRAHSLTQTQRALLLSLVFWLCFSPYIRLAKKTHFSLGGTKGSLIDPSGHVFLVGSMLTPLRVYVAEVGHTFTPAHTLLTQAVCTLLLHVATCTAAFYHPPLDTLLAYLAIAGLQALVVGCQRGKVSRGVVYAAGVVWGVGWLVLQGIITSRGVSLPSRAPMYAAHDCALFLAALAITAT